jgi:hypothetical protein
MLCYPQFSNDDKILLDGIKAVSISHGLLLVWLPGRIREEQPSRAC